MIAPRRLNVQVHVVVIVDEFANRDICWDGPPPTSSGILGIYRGPNIIIIISSGQYLWVGAQPKTYRCYMETPRAI